jgi:PEP-CTERM motif
VSASISGLTLAAGTYYLSIYNGSPTEFLGWVESDVTVHGQSLQSAGAAPLPLSGAGTGRDMAFRIIGEPVPEPSTLLLLVTGLAATGLRRMRRRD